MMMLGAVYFVFLPSVITTPLAGKVVARFGTRPTLWASFALAIAGLPLLLSSSFAALLLGLALVAVGTFFAQATATGFVGRAATTDRGSASGLYLASYFLGGLVGSAVLGQVFDRLGWTACVIGIGAALVLGALLATRLLIAESHRPDAATAFQMRRVRPPISGHALTRSLTTEIPMPNCIAQVCSAALLAFAMMMSSASHGGAEGLKPAVSASGVIATKSAYGVEETVERLKKDIAAKGIVFFQEIDQAALACQGRHRAHALGPADLRQSAARHAVHHRQPAGRPRLAGAHAGLSRRRQARCGSPTPTSTGSPSATACTSRDAQFHMASQVAASIASSVAAH